jgi:hypothetical protein
VFCQSATKPIAFSGESSAPYTSAPWEAYILHEALRRSVLSVHHRSRRSRSPISQVSDFAMDQPPILVPPSLESFTVPFLAAPTATILSPRTIAVMPTRPKRFWTLLIENRILFGSASQFTTGQTLIVDIADHRSHPFLISFQCLPSVRSTNTHGSLFS